VNTFPETVTLTRKDRDTMRSLFVLLTLVAVLGTGCAKAAQVAVDADDAAFTRIESLKLTKDAHCDAGTFPASACVSMAKAFVPLWDGYLAVNRALASGTPLSKIDPTVTALQEAGRGFAAEVNRLQDGEGKRILLDLLAGVLGRF
jgi:hypothetical protein